MITQGATDEAVATAVGGVSRVSVHRHRVNHIQPLARAVADAVGKGMPARKERERALAVAEKGGLDPASFLSVGSLTEELRKAADRIERASSEAEKAGSLTALAQLLGQTHRNVETRAKLAGHGNFGSSKVAIGIGVGGGPAFTPFTVRINHNDGRSETLVMAREGAPAFEVLDAQTGRPFAEHNGGAIVTRGEESTHDLTIVPAGYPTTAPVIDHEPSDDTEQAAAPTTNEADKVDGDMDIDGILNSVFDKPAPESTSA
jgi:hypothetical protein